MGLNAGLFCFLSEMPEYSRNRKEKNIVKEDKNDVYGIYYHADGEHVDQGVHEIVDVNDYYGI